MKLRIFGGEDCDVCRKLIENLKLVGVHFVFVDAFADETQALCDKNGVSDLPHVQVLLDDGTLFWEETGDVSITSILHRMNDGLSNTTGNG